MRHLDLDQLRTFAAVAEMKSFTAAGASLGATQSAVSLRIAKLEEQLGRTLLARTPRSVSLTPDGLRVLEHARALLDLHDGALADLSGEEARVTLRLAVSDHAAGARLTPALAALKGALPRVTPELVVGPSAAMLALYDAGEADAAVVRAGGGRRDGRTLFADPLVWAAEPSFRWPPRTPLPLVALRKACAVKAAAVRALDDAGLPWRFAFLGGSVTALQSAVEAGLGVGVFGTRHVPAGCRILGAGQGLPELPTGTVVLHTRLAGATRRALVSAFAST